MSAGLQRALICAMTGVLAAIACARLQTPLASAAAEVAEMAAAPFFGSWLYGFSAPGGVVHVELLIARADFTGARIVAAPAGLVHVVSLGAALAAGVPEGRALRARALAALFAAAAGVVVLGLISAASAAGALARTAGTPEFPYRLALDLHERAAARPGQPFGGEMTRALYLDTSPEAMSVMLAGAAASGAAGATLAHIVLRHARTRLGAAAPAP